MTQSDSSRRLPDSVDAALAKFTEAWFDGKRHDPEAFCRAHPDCGPELQERIEDFIFVTDVFPRDGGGGPAGAGSVGVTAGRLLDDFRIVGRIGSGGMGEVWEAEQISLHRRVALKVLPSHLSFSEASVKKFRREAMAGGRQNHPGIVAVHAVGEHEGVHFIAQELVGGGVTLADRIGRYPKPDDLPIGYFRWAARLIAKIADALGHAHTSGVIHRDVKPSNILLTPQGGEPKVTDFGLAKVEDALALTRTGDLIGTPFYMSPEQAESGRGSIDERTDIFSLGVTLYETLTLTVPFDGKSSREVLKKILDAEPRDPSRINARVPRDLAVICLKAIEKQKVRRYASMAELADDLRRYLAGEPIVARPAGAVTRAIKRIRRNPARSAAMGLAVVAAVVVAVLFWIWIQKETVKDERNILFARNEIRRLLNVSADAVRDDPGTALVYAVRAADLAGNLPPNESEILLTVKNTIVAALARCHELRILPLRTGRKVVFGPRGERVFVLLDSGRIAVWDWETGEEIFLRCDFGSDNTDLILSPKGGQLALSSWDSEESSGKVRIFDVETWTSKIVFEGGWKIRDLAFRPDENFLAVVGNEMRVNIVDLSTGRVAGDLTDFCWFISTVDFSSDGILLAVGCDDSTVSVWNIETGEREILSDDAERAVVSVEFEPAAGGRELLILYEGGQAVLRKAFADKSVPVPVFDPEEIGVSSVAFSPDGESVAVAFEDGTVRIIATGSLNERRLPERLHAELLGHRKSILSVAYNRLGNRIVTTSSDGTTRVWSTDAGFAELAVDRGMSNRALSADGSWIARAPADLKGIHLFDVATKSRIATPVEYRDKHKIPDEDGIYRVPPDIEYYTRLSAPGSKAWLQEAQVNGFSFNEEGSRLATYHTTNVIRVRDLPTGSIAAQFVHAKDVDCLKISPTGRKVAVALSDNSFCFLDVEGERGDGLRLEWHSKRINEIAFDSFGRLAATASDDGTIAVWDCEREELIATFQFGEVPVTHVALSPDGGLVAAAGKDFRIRLWNIASREEISSPEMTHENTINSIKFGPDGSQLFSASADRSARAWELDGESFVAFVGHRGAVNMVRLSPDRSLVLTVSEDKNAMIWKSSDGVRLFGTLHDDPVLFGEFTADGRSFVTATERGPVRTIPVDPVAYARRRTPCGFDDRKRWIYPPAGNGGGEENDGGAPASAGPDLCIWDWPLVDPENLSPDRDMEPILFLVKKTVPGRPEPAAPVAMVSIWLYDPQSEIPVREVCSLGCRAVSHFSPCPDGYGACFVEREFDRSGKLLRSLVKGLRLDGASGAGDVVEFCRLEKTCIDSLAWSAPRAIYLEIRGVGGSVHRDGICLIDPEGGADQIPRPLIGRKGEFFGQPNATRDGTKICFIHFAGASDSNRWEIWHALLTGDDDAVVEPRRLTDNSVQELKCRFSSDGGAIYSLRARDKNRNGHYGVVIHGLLEGNSRLLFEIGRAESVNSYCVSQKGLVAFVVSDVEMKSATLHIANPVTRQRAEILPGERDCQICSPGFLHR